MTFKWAFLQNSEQLEGNFSNSFTYSICEHWFNLAAKYFTVSEGAEANATLRSEQHCGSTVQPPEILQSSQEQQQQQQQPVLLENNSRVEVQQEPAQFCAYGWGLAEFELQLAVDKVERHYISGLVVF